MKKGIIYIHRNIINNKVYIGSTIQRPDRRWRKSGLSSYKNCPAFYNALKRYGWKQFESQILEENILFNEISKKEEFYIKEFNSLAPNGYNTNNFVDGRIEFSEETKLKISEARKKYYETLTEPLIAPNRKEHKFINDIECKHCIQCNQYYPLYEFGNDKNNWDNLMRYCRQCWVKYNDQFRKRLSEDEMKKSYQSRTEKMRQSIINNYKNNPETRKKLSEARSKPIKGVHILTGETIQFKSGLEAKANGFNNTNIKKAMTKNKPYKEYMWFYEQKEKQEFEYEIFEHELKDPIKAQIWASIQNPQKNVIYARDCEVKIITSETQRIFMANNHLQGAIEAKVKYGLFYNNILVAAMTFGQSRYNKEYEWELLRFCTLLNTRVVGGASRLFSYFIKDFNPNTILSYANMRFSEGNLYEKLGFIKKGKSSPNYFYKKDGKIYSRIQFQKHKLKYILSNFNENLSEKENMLNHGYEIFYDRGNLIYIWTKK